MVVDIEVYSLLGTPDNPGLIARIPRALSQIGGSDSQLPVIPRIARNPGLGRPLCPRVSK
jgi:hypothetical protein